MALTIRNISDPYDLAECNFVKFNDQPVPAGETSDVIQVRLWNSFGSLVEDPVINVAFTFSAISTGLGTNILTAGNPPPIEIRETHCGNGDIVVSVIETEWKSIGLDTLTNEWKYFSLSADGYGSSGSSDGILASNGWVQLEIRLNAPITVQRGTYPLYFYIP